MAALAAVRVHAGHAEGAGSDVVAVEGRGVGVGGVVEADLGVPAPRRAGLLGARDQRVGEVPVVGALGVGADHAHGVLVRARVVRADERDVHGHVLRDLVGHPRAAAADLLVDREGEERVIGRALPRLRQPAQHIEKDGDGRLVVDVAADDVAVVEALEVRIDAHDGALGDAERAGVLGAGDVGHEAHGHGVLGALAGARVVEDVGGVVVADHLARHRTAVATVDRAGLALDAVIVDAAELADAQGAVSVDAAHHKPDRVQVGPQAHDLLGTLATDAHVGRGVVIHGHLVAHLGERLSQPLVSLGIVADRALHLHARAQRVEQIVLVDVVCHGDLHL